MHENPFLESQKLEKHLPENQKAEVYLPESYTYTSGEKNYFSIIQY